MLLSIRLPPRLGRSFVNLPKSIFLVCTLIVNIANAQPRSETFIPERKIKTSIATSIRPAEFRLKQAKRFFPGDSPPPPLFAVTAGVSTPPGTSAYQNDQSPITAAYDPGANQRVADDLTLSNGGCDAVYYNLAVFGFGTTGNYDVRTELWTGDPCVLGSVMIAGTEADFLAISNDQSSYLLETIIDPPIAIPQTVWMAVTFYGVSAADAAWVLAGTAEIGSTANYFSENDTDPNPDRCALYNFTGTTAPFAGFWANINCGVSSPPTGACCDGASCTQTIETECLSPAVWQGAASSCQPTTCLTGVCCSGANQETCAGSYEATCIGGVFLTGLDCSSNPCPPGAVDCSGTSTVIMDFEFLSQENASQHSHGPLVQEEGMRLVADHPDPVSNPPGFETAGTQNQNYFGSTAPWHHISNGIITLTEQDGRVFDLCSITLASLEPIDTGPFQIDFVGTRNDGSQITDSIVVDTFHALSPHPLIGMVDIILVDWNQGSGGPSGPAHVFDDIIVVIGCDGDDQCNDGNMCNGEERCSISGDCTSVLSEDCDLNNVEDSCDLADCLPTQNNCQDCNANFVLDSCDIDGLEGADANSNGIPDECEHGSCCDANGGCIVVLESDCLAGDWTLDGICTPNTCPQPGACCAPDGACTISLQSDCQSSVWGEGVSCSPNACPIPPTVTALGSRYLRIEPNAWDSGQPIALRVTSPDLPCMTKHVTLDSGLGRLVDSATSLPASQWGTVTVSDSEVIPATQYLVETITSLGASPPVTVTTPIWGDVAAAFGAVNALDVVGIVDRFRNRLGAPPLEACDLNPAIPNQTVDALDIVMVVDSFRGLPYPYPSPCP